MLNNYYWSCKKIKLAQRVQVIHEKKLPGSHRESVEFRLFRTMLAKTEGELIDDKRSIEQRSTEQLLTANEAIAHSQSQNKESE